MLKKIALLALAGCAALSLSGCGGSSKPPGVAITASSNTVDGSDTVTLTGAVTNDKNSAGVSWAVTSGGGTLSNQTTTSATYTAPAATSSQQSITITATSVATTTQTGTVALTVAAAPAVTSLTSAQQSVAVGTAYSATLSVTGGIAPFKNWALAGGSGSLPPCLSLNSAGVLSSTSTPTAACVGVYSGIKFTMTDSGTPNAMSASSSAQTITVTGPTVTFSPTLPASHVGVVYAGTVAATGVIGASTYSLAGGALPADLGLNASTGAITGTPKASDAGTFTFSVKVVDAFGDTATSGNLTITITAPTITFPSSLPAGAVGTAYTGSVAATGPVGASAYTITSGALPADLSLNSGTGAITGTPKASDVGTFAITVKVVDAYGDTATSGPLNITVTAPTIRFPASLPSDTVGTAYSGSVAASGPVGSTTYTIASGSLPADLSLNSGTGVITGTPKASDVGTFTITVKVVDAFGDTATSGSLSISITAAPAIAFTTAPAATATFGVVYSSALTATGGGGALTYGISVGSLPAGLILNGSTGAITGTPTTVGAVTFTAKAQDSFGDTPATQSYTIAVSPGAASHFAVALTSSSTITAGGAVTFTVTAVDAGGNTATGYSGTVAFTSTDTAAALPANSTLASGTGSFSATLKTAASQTITANDTANATITGTSASITVKPGSAASLVVTAPADATTNVAFNFSVTAKDSYGNTATGFADTVNFSSTDGSAALPSPSTLTSGTGAFSATMKTTGAQTITATDAANGSIKGTSSAISVANTVTITATGIGPFNLGQSISQTLTGSGGSGNSADYTWSWTGASGSSTPPGLSLSTAGLISGTPTTSGTYSVSVTVKDTGVTPNQTYSQTFSIVINGALKLPTPNPASLPGGYVGVGYSGSVAASGGSGNYCYTVISGLPSDSLAGPSNNAPCGYLAGSYLVSGTPTSAATVQFTLKVTDTSTGEAITQTYTIAVTTPTAPSLPTPSSSIPGSGTNGQSYSQTVSATGGVGPTYTWTVNGTTISGSLALGASGLSSQFSVSNSGSSTLSISGNPTSIGSFTFTAQVKDNTTGLTSSTQTYTIQVNSAGSNASGQISLNNFCGSGTTLNLSIFSVTIANVGGTTFTQTVTTDSNGNYTFTAVPNGNYTITPSLKTSGPSVVFYPATQSMSVNNSNISGQNFSVSLGYTVSGTVAYSGTTTHGRVYVDLVGSCGGSGGNGTSIAYPFTSGGAFSIRGVPPGSYTLQAGMDPSTLNQGAQNEADPAGSAPNPVIVAAGGVQSGNGQILGLTDPSLSAPTTSPNIKSIAPIDGGVVISYGGGSIKDNNGLEMFTSYTVQWSTSSNSGFSASNQATFKATGGNANVWIVRTGNANVSGSLSNGTAYYFKIWGSNPIGAGPSETSPTAYTPGPPASGTGLYRVTGTITIPSSVTVNSGAPLYAGLYDQNSNTAYGAVITNPSNSVGNNFTVYVPSGSNYTLFGILDQNKDGLIDADDDTNVNQNNGASVSVTTATTGLSVTLPATNTDSVVGTRYQSTTSSGGVSTSYALNFDLRPGTKLPVAVTLTGGPNVLNPVDIGSYCQGCGSVQFQNYVNIQSDTPAVGDTYTFTIVYSDGSTDTNVTAQVTGWDGGATLVGAGGAGLSTNLAPGGTSNTSVTPNFTWTFPTNPGDFTYQFQLSPNNGGTLWYIPGNNSNSNGFTYAQTSGGSGTTGTINWGVDPTGDTSNNLPNGTTLSGSSTYYWYITASDSNGNQATASTYFTTP